MLQDCKRQTGILKQTKSTFSTMLLRRTKNESSKFEITLNGGTSVFRGKIGRNLDELSSIYFDGKTDGWQDGVCR